VPRDRSRLVRPRSPRMFTVAGTPPAPATLAC
jgi:hypothetical protein